MILDDGKELKPYTIVKSDGSKEVVYIAANPIEHKTSFRDGISVAYFVMATIAFII